MRLIILVGLLLYYALCSAGVIIVGNSQPFCTLRKAISVANPFDTIYLSKGIYREGNIIINKSLTLIGQKGAVLDGEGKYELLTISAKKFVVSGITFKNSGYSSMNDFASLKIIDASDFIVKNNTVVNASFAIHISNSNHFLISNNVITGTPRQEQNTGNGIHLWKCSHAIISKNYISGHRDGIYFEFVTQSRIRSNKSIRNIRYGLHFMFSHFDEYISNTFRNNGAGVAVMFSQHITMKKNKFEANMGSSSYGILLKEISDGTISANTFEKNTIGIMMEGTNRINIVGNKFNRNGYALKVQASCSDNKIEKNNFTGNTFDVTTNGTLVLNSFGKNYWDKYEGYDLNHDGKGDIPYHPVSLYAFIIETNPITVMFLRSFMVTLLDKTEKVIPSITPENLKDNTPMMKPYTL